MHPRYFVGLALPENLSERIQAVQKLITNKHQVMEPLVPHITLLHPNILMTLSPLYFLPLVKEASDSLLPMRVGLTKSAMFDKRVLYIAVDSPELITLQEKLVSILPDELKARYQIGREYAPHVTIAQAKPLQELSTDVIDTLSTKLEPLLPTEFTSSSLSQFRWQANRTYTVTTI